MPPVDKSLERIIIDAVGNALGVVGNPLETSGSIGTITLPTVIYNDKKTVSATGTAEALAGSQVLVSGVHVKALIGNTGLVYVGKSSVDSTNGYELDPGESVFIEIADLATVYVDVAVNGEGVTYIGT